MRFGRDPCGLSPAVTSSTAAVSAPTPKMFNSSGAAALTSGAIWSSIDVELGIEGVDPARQDHRGGLDPVHERHHHRVVGEAWRPR